MARPDACGEPRGGIHEQEEPYDDIEDSSGNHHQQGVRREGLHPGLRQVEPLQGLLEDEDAYPAEGDAQSHPEDMEGRASHAATPTPMTMSAMMKTVAAERTHQKHHALITFHWMTSNSVEKRAALTTRMFARVIPAWTGPAPMTMRARSAAMPIEKRNPSASFGTPKR